MKVIIKDKEIQIDKEFDYLLDFCTLHYSTDGYLRTVCNLTNLFYFQDFDYEVGQKVYFHRLIYQSKIGRKLEKWELVDHINHNKLDNRIENLRVLAHSQNTKNKKLKEEQFYHNICYDKHMNYFTFQHRESRTRICRHFRTLHSALEFFQNYDRENDFILTKSIHDRKPIEEIEDIVLENDAFCEECSIPFWSQSTLKQHQKKYH